MRGTEGPAAEADVDTGRAAAPSPPPQPESVTRQLPCGWGQLQEFRGPFSRRSLAATRTHRPCAASPALSPTRPSRPRPMPWSFTGVQPGHATPRAEELAVGAG